MKRYLTTVLAGLMVVGMTLPLYAAEIKATGQVRQRYRNWTNLDLDDNDGTSGAGGDRHYFDNRTRFGVDAKLSDGVRARIELERYFDWGTQTPINPGSITAPNVRQAWMDFAIPGSEQSTPWRIQAGRSFFSVGHQFVWGNSLTGEDGITVYGPLGPGNLKLRIGQQRISTQQVNAATRRFGSAGAIHMAIDYKVEVAPKQNVEFYVIYGNDKNVGDFSTMVQDAAGTLVTSAEEYWIGGAYSGAIGPVAIRAEVTGQFGDARSNACLTAAGGPALTAATCVTPGQDIDRSAFFIFADGTYKPVPEASIGLGISFATGDDNQNDADFDNFVAPLASFTSSPTRVWTDSGFFFGNRSGRGVGSAATNRRYNFWGRGTEDIDSAASVDNTGAGLFSPGLLEVKVKGKYVVINPKLTLFGNLAFLWAAEDEGVPGGGGDKYLGTEIDGKISYRPYQNLSITGYAGYFIPGDFFEQGGALRAATIAAGGTPVEDDAWIFRAEAVVTF